MFLSRPFKFKLTLSYEQSWWIRDEAYHNENFPRARFRHFPRENFPSGRLRNHAWWHEIHEDALPPHHLLEWFHDARNHSIKHIFRSLDLVRDISGTRHVVLVQTLDVAITTITRDLRNFSDLLHDRENFHIVHLLPNTFRQPHLRITLITPAICSWECGTGTPANCTLSTISSMI